jgi:hypothetical protein
MMMMPSDDVYRPFMIPTGNLFIYDKKNVFFFNFPFPLLADGINIPIPDSILLNIAAAVEPMKKCMFPSSCPCVYLAVGTLHEPIGRAGARLRFTESVCMNERGER